MNVAWAVPEEGMYAFVMCVAKGRTYVVGGIRDRKAVWLDSNDLRESDSVGILMLRKEKYRVMQTRHRGNNACD